MIRKILKAFMQIIISILLLIVLLFSLGWFFQEKLIFFPSKLTDEYKFNFCTDFEEKYYTMEDGISLHALLFKAEKSKGIVYYLHGNAGSVKDWGTIADLYTSLQYDILILDYRGYGKSRGKITSQEQIYKDVQEVYEQLKIDYSEQKIVLMGYSIGTGLASMLAKNNNSQQLILKAPYFNLPDLVKQIYPFIPVFFVKYKFEINLNLAETSIPITIFHGLQDELIKVENSKRLIKLCRPGDRLILLNNQGHNGINENPEFRSELFKLLN